MRTYKLAAGIIALGAGLLAAQSPAFDVVSIKPHDPALASSGADRIIAGSFRENGITLTDLIYLAYGLPAAADKLISGAPAWLSTAKFDIAATAPAGVAMPDTFRTMLQNMLRDRFQLRVHRVVRIEDAYALTVAPGGAHLQPASPACGSPVPDADCGTVSFKPAVDGMRPVSAKAASMTELIAYLQDHDFQAYPIADQTGIKSTFDFAFAYHWETAGRAADSDTRQQTEHRNLLSFQNALRDNLGLAITLRPAKIAISGIIVDHAALPTAN